MLLKILNILLLIHIVHICGNLGVQRNRIFKLPASQGEPEKYGGPDIQANYVIEDEETRLVLTEVGTEYGMTQWNNTNSQLWTVERDGDPGQYIIRNVASRRDVGCIVNGNHHNLLNLHLSRPGTITIEDPFIVLKQHNNKLFCFYNDPSNQTDDWVFAPQDKITDKKFVIENMKTGKALEVKGTALKLREWENRDSQLWTVQPHGSGYYIINVATGRTLVYTKDNVSYRTLKLNPGHYTRIEAEGTNAFLTDSFSFPRFFETKQSDGSDKWLLTQRENKKKGLSYNIFRRIL